MISIRQLCVAVFGFFALGAFCCVRGNSQAALLMEQPYGFFGTLNPTGHNAIYFERICAETPVKLRRCQAGEMGVVISRYQGIDGYDWVATPLLPYLYSVDNASDVPAHVDRDTVMRLRNRYRETHLESLGLNLPAGSIVRGGWTQLVGAAYERRIYAFRFETTAEQDDALIAQMNAGPNQTQFDLLFNNCADFARVVLNDYFPRTFRRSLFPDAGMTTPKQIAYKLVKYSRKHPETQLAVFEIPQIPGYRHESRSNKGVDESFVTTIYAVPLALLHPYLAGALFVDYLARGRYRLVPKDTEVLGPDNLSALTAPTPTLQNSASAGIPTDRPLSAEPSAGEQAPGTAPNTSAATLTDGGANPGLKGIGIANE
jgi:hypothetical protein